MARGHRMVAYHLRKGNMTRQPCSVCGRADSHAHHDDYSRPLDVMWLCPVHHKERHAELDAMGHDYNHGNTPLDESNSRSPGLVDRRAALVAAVIAERPNATDPELAEALGLTRAQATHARVRAGILGSRFRPKA